MYNLRQQNTSGYPVTFLMLSNQDHITAVTGITPTILLSKNGSSFSAASGSVQEISYGWYKFNYTTADTSTLGELIFRASGLNADLFEAKYTVVPFNPFDATRLGLTALPNANAGASYGLPINDAILIGVIDDVSANTSGFNLESSFSNSDDFYNGSVIAFTSGTLKGLARKVYDYVGTSRKIITSTPLPSAPSNGDPFVILGRID